MLSKAWWLFLITGTLWLIMSLIVFRMELETVYAVSILFGVIAIAAGIDEFLSIGAVHGGWKWLHGFLGVIFVIAGIVAFANPDWTFLAIASIIGWWFLFKGILDVIAAFALEARERALVDPARRRPDRDRARLLGGRQLPRAGDPPRRLRRLHVPEQGHHRLRARLPSARAALGSSE